MNKKLSDVMRDHVEIMNQQIANAQDDTDALGAICNTFVFITRLAGVDALQWVQDSTVICERIEAEQHGPH